MIMRDHFLFLYFLMFRHSYIFQFVFFTCFLLFFLLFRMCFVVVVVIVFVVVVLLFLVYFCIFPVTGFNVCWIPSIILAPRFGKIS